MLKKSNKIPHRTSEHPMLPRKKFAEKNYFMWPT
jgi:hypothetical protein